MTEHPNLLGGPPPTHLPGSPEATAALESGTPATEVAAAHPADSLAWAVLAEEALDRGQPVAAYAYARTGYHRGLDSLRRNGWKGFGPVPWSHVPNRGFLRALSALGRATAAIGETDEVARIAAFLDDCDPSARRSIDPATSAAGLRNEEITTPVDVEASVPSQYPTAGNGSPSGTAPAAPRAGCRALIPERIAGGVLRTANRLTQPARQRAGLGEFLLNDAAATDRLQARLYFGLAARLWAQEQQDKKRLAVLRAGFDAVPVSPRRVVELGCGAGAAAREAAARWPESEVRGYDISGPMVNAARRSAGPAVTFERQVAGDVVTVADFVFFCNYLPHPGVVRRILQDGGHVLAVSSFQRRTGEALTAHWTAHGFRLISTRDVGEGSYELYASV